MRIIGIMLVLAGMVIGGLTFWPMAKLEVAYHSQPQTNQEIEPIDAEWGIVIPKIGANAKIVKNVNPFEAAVYQKALTQGVAHAAGTPLPGDEGNSFLFSHSSADFFLASQYNSVFYLLSKLEPGDPVYIYREGQKLTFRVTDKRIVADTAVNQLVSANSNPQLTLMTCWPPGTSLKRLLVSAMLDR